jgi:hypothetical protein
MTDAPGDHPRPRSMFTVSTMGSLMAPANRRLLNRILHHYRVDLL